jgi:hypothetical protein
VLTGDQYSSLPLLKMMVDNVLIEFRCNWIYKVLMQKGGTYNHTCKRKMCASVFLLVARTSRWSTSHYHKWIVFQLRLHLLNFQMILVSKN